MSRVRFARGVGGFNPPTGCGRPPHWWPTILVWGVGFDPPSPLQQDQDGMAVVFILVLIDPTGYCISLELKPASDWNKKTCAALFYSLVLCEIFGKLIYCSAPCLACGDVSVASYFLCYLIHRCSSAQTDRQVAILIRTSMLCRGWRLADIHHLTSRRANSRNQSSFRRIKNCFCNRVKMKL